MSTMTAARWSRTAAGDGVVARRPWTVRWAQSLPALAYVVSGAVLGAVALVWLPVATVAGGVIATPWLTRPIVALERRRVKLLGGPAIPDPHQRPDRPGPVAWLRTRCAEAATWRELLYLAVHGTVLLALDVAAVAIPFTPLLAIGALQLTSSGPSAMPGSSVGPAGVGGADLVVILLVAVLAGLMVLVLAFVAVAYLVPLVAVAHSQLARQLLSAGHEETVRKVTRSRARLIDAFEVERRRIERDLHDGAQQRLLALGLTLVAAQLELDDGNHAAAGPLVRQAADQARSALAELGELVRGIHPRVLTDLGLVAAVAELADRSAIPVAVALDMPQRLPPGVESAAYFGITEALANAVKHADATLISVDGRLHDGILVLEVRDDGIGGADPGNGTGLTGLADRVDAVNGSLSLRSPPGGPTTLRLELPCYG
jgi:signal transduction histidine kinase